MKQIKFLGVVALALSLGLAACNGGGNSKGSSKHTHTWGDYAQVKAATCTEKGKEERVCSGCGQKQERDINALGHQFLEGDADVKTDVVPAGCETDGSYKHVCQRCQQTIQETVQATGHDWEDAADQTGAVEATCTEAGTKIQTCKNGCGKTQTVEVPALQHDFDEGTPLTKPAATEKNVFGNDTIWAEITNYSCKRGDSFRYAWSAKEVNFDYKNVPDGAEPELLDDGEGIRFFGRPICNAMELNAQGDAAQSGNTPTIPDPDVKGSRFEFDFEFDQDLTDVCLSAEFTPAQYTSDVFRNGDGVEDWTPGYKNVTLKTPGVHWTQEEINAAQEGDPAYGKTVEDWKTAPEYEGEIIKPFRFIIYLDGEEVELDPNVSNQAAGRKWYQFPCKLNLTKGKHNLNIAMAGGYRHVFYQFSFEKRAPEHQHNFTVGDKAADSALRAVSCRCGQNGYELQAADLTSGQKEPSRDGTNTAAKNTRLGKNDIYDDVWNITGIAAGTYDLYLEARASAGNANAYWNAKTAQDNGDTAANNGNGSQDYRYKVKVDSGDYVNIGGNTAADKYSAYGLNETTPAWTTKAVARITVANGAASITIHNENNGYAIWVYGARLLSVAA